MTITPTALLSLPIITTGTESGTWGDVVDNGLTSYLDIAIAGGLAISITGTGTVVTLANTAGTSAATGIVSTTAQYAILNISGAKTGACTLNLPVTSKWYIINNAGTGGFALTVRGVTPTTGVTLVDAEKCIVAWNGTDYVKITSSVVSNLTGTLPATNGGTGQSSYAVGDLLYAPTTTTVGKLADVATGNAVISGGVGVAPSYGKIGLTTHVSGTLPIANGGTNATSAPAAMASLMGFTTTATAAGTTTLTNTSSYYQQFTGVTTQTVTLPVTSTLVTGWTFHIVNNSTGNVTVNSSGANLVITVLPGTTAMCTCIGTALTTAADWEAGFTDFSTATGTGAVVLGTTPTLNTPALAGETFSTAATVTAGTDAQGQGALTSDYNVITTAAANPSGVTLPTATVGRRIIVVNKGANPINIYPATGGAIDALAANAAIPLPVGSTIEFDASTTTQWYSTYNAYTTLQGFATTATAAGTTTLTSVSGYEQYFTGTTTQTVVLPVVSTLALGRTYTIVNNSTGNLSVQSSGANALITVLPGTTAKCTCILITGTTAASWEAGLTNFNTATGTGAVVLGTSPAITTSLTTGSTSFDLLNTTATTLNIGGAATVVSIGAATGTLTVANTTLAAKAITASTTLGVTGVSTLTGGAVVQGLTVGLGAGAVTSNTVVGRVALFLNSTGFNNVAVGDSALNSSNGNYNTAVGFAALVNATGSNNTGFGYAALQSATGSNNTGIGNGAGYAITSGSNNVVLGSYDGSAAPISATGSNWIVLSDGAGTVRQVIDSSGNVGIGVTAPTAKLTINHSGAGDVLLVEDSTNPDSTPVVINSSGDFVVGHTANLTSVNALTPNISNVITGSAQIAYSTHKFGDNTVDAKFAFNKARGTVAVPTSVGDGDGIGKIWFAGYDGASYIRGAQIDCQISGTPGLNDMPGRMTFSTTAAGASTPTERMRITPAGYIGIGGSPNANFEVMSATGSATPVATEIRISTTSSGSDWSTTLPWGRLGYYSADVSGSGPKLHAAIDVISVGVTGGSSNLVFSTSDGVAGLTENLRIDSTGDAQFLTGAVVVYAPTPATFSALATLTNANLQTQILVTSGLGYTLTMPTGTTLDTLVAWAAVDLGFDFSLINTGSGTITMAGNTGVTIVGTTTVLVSTSGRFRVRRTAASTYVVYRIA